MRLTFNISLSINVGLKRTVDSFNFKSKYQHYRMYINVKSIRKTLFKTNSIIQYEIFIRRYFFLFFFVFGFFFIVLFCFLKLFIKIVIPKKSCILTFLKVTLSEAWIFLNPFIIRNRKQKKKKEQLFIFGP